MDTKVYKAIIANLMEQLEDQQAMADEPALTPPQLQVANEALEEIRDSGDWQFDDISDRYNLHVVRQFVLRHCDNDLNPEGQPELHMKGDSLEAFIIELQELVK